MKALDWFVLAVTGTAAYLLLKRLAAPGQPGRTFYAAARSMTPADREDQEQGRAMRGGITDWSAPGQSPFLAPPSGYVWDELNGGYVKRDGNGAISAIYV